MAGKIADSIKAPYILGGDRNINKSLSLLEHTWFETLAEENRQEGGESRNARILPTLLYPCSAIETQKVTWEKSSLGGRIII